MRSCALDPSGMDAIADELKLSGFDPVHVSRLECSLGTVAWTLDAHKLVQAN